MINDRKELLRKLVHFTGILYIPLYNIFGVDIISISLAVGVSIAIAFEVLRIKKGFLRSLLREYEINSVASYLYTLIALLFITIFFPKEVVFVSVFTAIVGDGCAGLGRILNRSWTASPLMFMSSLSLTHFFGLLDFFSFSAILVATLVERVKRFSVYRVEDNFTVPISTATVCSVKYIFHA